MMSDADARRLAERAAGRKSPTVQAGIHLERLVELCNQEGSGDLQKAEALRSVVVAVAAERGVAIDLPHFETAVFKKTVATPRSNNISGPPIKTILFLVTTSLLMIWFAFSRADTVSQVKTSAEPQSPKVMGSAHAPPHE